MFLRDLQLILSYWCFKLNSEVLCNLDFVCILFKIDKIISLSFKMEPNRT